MLPPVSNINVLFSKQTFNTLGKREQIKLMIVKKVRVMTFAFVVSVYVHIYFLVFCHFELRHYVSNSLHLIKTKSCKESRQILFYCFLFIGLFSVIFRSVVYKIEQNVISLSCGSVDTNAIEQIQCHFYLSVLMGQVLDYYCQNKWPTLWAKLHICGFLMLGEKC